jgi:hypothetical protein
MVYYPDDGSGGEDLPEAAQEVIDALKPEIVRIALIDTTDPESVRVVDRGTSKDLVLLLGNRDYGLRYGNFKKYAVEVLKPSPDASVLDLRLDDRITVTEDDKVSSSK